MKYTFILLLFLYNGALLAQVVHVDSINFNDELKFERKVYYSKIGHVESVKYTSNVSNLKKEEIYDAKQRIIKEMVVGDEPLREISYRYFEKGQVIKKFDILNNIALTPQIKVHISYPHLAREEGIHGLVKIEFAYDDNCLPTDFQVLNQLGYGIDEEVVAKMKLMVALSNKYNIKTDNCKGGLEPFVINFTLE